MDLKRFLHWAGDNLGYSALKEVRSVLCMALVKQLP